jgi:hypothetical protein
LIPLKCNYTARFQRAFEKPPAGERSVLPTIESEVGKVRLPFELLRLLVVSLAILAACSSGAQRRREAQERFRQEWAKDLQQRDSAIDATREALRVELPRREAQWASHGITDYRLAVRVTFAFASLPLGVVTVRGDSTLVRNALGQPLSADQIQWLALSVPKLFERIRRTLANAHWQIEARFDSIYGFPTFIQIDNRSLYDAGDRTVVEAFEILSSRQPSSPLRQN